MRNKSTDRDVMEQPSLPKDFNYQHAGQLMRNATAVGGKLMAGRP